MFRGILALALLATTPLPAAVYYMDSTAGLDSNPGTLQAPWKTLAKVNATTFLPGDRILFKSGSNWTGQLNPKGSGSPGQPIVIDRYGAGRKPRIDGIGLTGQGVVYLFNQEYWEINNLEVVNDASTAGDRRGIYLSASNYTGTVVNHLHIKNCHIHNIKGFVDRVSNAAKRTGGIVVEVIDDTPQPTRFHDILIQDCVISTVDNQGIALNNKNSVSDYPGTPAWEARKFTKVVIRGNSINDIAKNAMIIRLTDESGLVERNVCWDTAYRAYTGNTIFSRSCRGTVFQYNEGYWNRAGERDPAQDADGSLYDADLQSPGCTFQYSYSHDNAHGLYWQCTTPQDTNIIVRYNVSQNDRGIIFCMNYDCTSTYVYNNTIYIGPGLSPRIIDERRSAAKAYWFYNNIIYNRSSTASYRWFNGVRTFSNNVFFGYHPDGEPDDPAKRNSDPMFLAPGTGATGLRTLAGYKLRPGSPCIDSAFEVPGRGFQDFWKNSLPPGGATDRGAHEWSGDTVSLPAIHHATIRDGANADANIDEFTVGYAMVKHHTDGLSAKSYFAFDLDGLTPDTSSPALLTLVRSSASGAHRIRLWGLQQPYPGMGDDLTWNTAQANDVTGNDLLTNGAFTARLLGNWWAPDGPGVNDLTISAKWQSCFQQGKVIVALSGGEDSANSQGGFRVLVTDPTQLPTLSVELDQSMQRPRLAAWYAPKEGTLTIAFASDSGGSFAVIGTQNLASPLPEWEPRGRPVEVSPGLYEFTEQVNSLQSFCYAVREL